MASRTGLSRRTVLYAEKGRVQLEDFVAMLASLDMADQLNMFLLVPGIFPIRLAKLKGRERQRATIPKNRKGQIKEATVAQ